MDDTLGVGLSSSPNINSVLKPPKPRVPLKDILSATHDEDNTASRKRRVSFANVNKIKEFSAGAESMVVCHTPAYEEPFSVSSDSSYPSGVDGGTPAKADPSSNPVPTVFYAEQKENLLVGTVSHPPSSLQLPLGGDMYYASDFTSKQSLENFKASRSSLPKSRLSGVFFQGDTLCDSPSSSPLDDMDFTGCVDFHQGTAGNSTRFSVGMDLTSVLGQSVKSMSNYSSDGMDLTKAAFSLRQVNDQQLSLHRQSGVNFTDGVSLNESDTLEFTDAVNDPRVMGGTTIPSNLTGNLLYSVNNTKYSESGMDLTKAAISRRSVGRHSARYSVNNMDLTEAIGIVDYSGLELAEAVRGSRMSTRYSMSEMDLTEAVTNKNYTTFSTNTMELTGVVGVEGDYYADSETSMDFTKPIHNVYMSPYEKGSTLLTDKMESTLMVNAGELEESCNNGMELSGVEANDKSSSKGEVVEDEEPSTTSITEDSQILTNKTEEIPSPKSSSCKNETYILPNVKPPENVQNQSVLSVSIEKQSERMQDLKPYEMSLHLSTICNTPQNDKSESKIAVSENIDDVVSIRTSYQMDVTAAVQNDSEILAEDESHHSNLVDPINISSGKGVISSSQCGDKIESRSILTPDLEILDNHHNTISSNKNSESPNPLVLNNCTNTSSSKFGDREAAQSELLEEITEMDISVLSINDETCTKEEASVTKGYETLHHKQNSFCRKESSDFQSGVLPNYQFLVEPKENDDKMEMSIIENDNGDRDEMENRLSTPCKTNERNNTLASVSKCDGPRQTINDTLTSFEKNKSCSKVSQEDSGVNSGTANAFQDLCVSPMNNSINGTPCCKNITLTRGGSRKSNMTVSVPQDLSESGREDTLIVISDETSVLESSIPHIELKRQAIDGSDIVCDVFRDEHSTWEPQSKGRKRSFEIALQPENDTEESPVKLICLEKAECTFDDDLLMNVTAPSFMMNTFHTQNETMPTFHTSHHSTTTSRTGNLNETCKTESGGQTFSENQSSIGRAVSVTGHPGGACEEENFSLRINISAELSVSKNPSSRNETRLVGMNVTETHQNVVNQNQGEEPELIALNNNATYSCATNSTLNFSHESESILHHSFIPRNKSSIVPQERSLLEAPNYLQINRNHAAGASCVREEGPPKSAHNEPASSEINFGVKNDERSSKINKHIEVLRETGKLRYVKDGVIVCDLIPGWIELQFSVEFNGKISNPAYKVIAFEKDKSVAEYLLQQLKMFPMPQEVLGLVSLLQDPRQTLLAEVARDISFLCDYHCGTFKGNRLTLEVVSTRHRRWIFIDVNVKYPLHLTETDITISEERIGELKLSRVRQVFNSVNKGHEVLFNFSEALRKLDN